MRKKRGGDETRMNGKTNRKALIEEGAGECDGHGAPVPRPRMVAEEGNGPCKERKMNNEKRGQPLARSKVDRGPRPTSNKAQPLERLLIRRPIQGPHTPRLRMPQIFHRLGLDGPPRRRLSLPTTTRPRSQRQSCRRQRPHSPTRNTRAIRILTRERRGRFAHPTEEPAEASLELGPEEVAASVVGGGKGRVTVCSAPSAVTAAERMMRVVVRV